MVGAPRGAGAFAWEGGVGISEESGGTEQRQGKSVPTSAPGADARLVLVDGHSLFHRAFHAMPELTNAHGQPTGAVYGFLTMLARLLAEQQPTHLAVALDRSEPTFRHRAFADYKAQRPPMPDALFSQLEIFHRALEVLRVPMVDYPGAEADDVIGTLATQASTLGLSVVIVTGDRDALQLVGSHITVLLTRRGITDVDRMDEAAVRQRYGVKPADLVDVKALMGDTSDNIPGVPGVGEKTACRLIAAFGGVSDLLGKLDQVQPARVRDLLGDRQEQIRLSQQLARIVTDLPLEVTLDALRRQPADGDAAREVFGTLGFRSLFDRFGLQAVPEDPAPTEQALRSPGEELRFEVVPAEAFAAEMRARAAVGRPTALALRTDAAGTPIGLGLSDAEGGNPQVWVASEDANGPPLFPAGAYLLTADSKPLCHWLTRCGQPWEAVGFDALLAAYLLDPLQSSYPLDRTLVAFGVLARSAGEGLAAELAVAARAIAELSRSMDDALREQGLMRVYREIELPLVVTLVGMEQAGIAVDRAALDQLQITLAQQIETVRKEIYDLANGPFNLNSTPQLRRVLFEELGLKPSKRTKTGYSTDAAVLEELAHAHPLPERLLAYRGLQKLQSTYVQALAEQIGPDGRVHTTFAQTVASTGRLSSQNPNLQNIPVREEIGKPVRRVFVARPGWMLVSADYSQVELRILAHFSADPGLAAAFRAGDDIHRATAAEVFGVDPEEVTPSQRGAAKAVNFGIVYGISDFGLARQLGCPVQEAHAIIQRYFERYPGVRNYMETVVRHARQTGEARTLYGRRRPLPEFTARDRATRAFAERSAMNSPIQGTAADLIKRAMIRCHTALGERQLQAVLVLQVHDELIFEAPEKECQAVAHLAREVMEGAGSEAALAVPLRAEVSSGRNWLEMTAITDA